MYNVILAFQALSRALQQPNRTFPKDREMVMLTYRAEVLPLEYEVPVEAAPEVGGGADVLEVVHADHVDHGADHPGRVLVHALEHGLLEFKWDRLR